MSQTRVGPLNGDANELLDRWGAPVDPELLVLSLTHRSFANEMGGLAHNERLEFLGDSVLSIVVTDWLFRNFPDKPESVLAKMRIAAVSQAPLAQTARTLNLGDYILLGVGENKTGGRDKDSILCDTFEALIGATYLSCGIEKTKEVVLEALQPLLAEIEDLSMTTDWKTRIQEYLSQTTESFDLVYQVEGSGPDHAREFSADVMIDRVKQGSATATSKRHAENMAARAAMMNLMGPEADPTVKKRNSDA